jgi:GWxTD domain-containing protein
MSQVVEPASPYRLTADFCRFRGGDDQHTLVEIYYSFPRNSLTFAPDSVGWESGADVTLLIHQNDSLVHGDRWLVPYVVRDTSDLASTINLVGNYQVQLREGEYSFSVVGRDRYRSERVDSFRITFPVTPFTTNGPAMSDIEFASIIRRGQKGGQFYKNTLDVIPNPGGIYSEEQSCYYYAEAYNLLVDGVRSDYVLNASVTDAVGREIMSHDRPKRGVGESSVLVDQFAVDKLKSGTYTLILRLVDTSSRVLAQSGKKFFVYNPALGVDSSLLTASSSVPFTVYMSMSEEELDQEFDWARYEAISDEIDRYEELSGVESKRAFLTDFWRNRMPGLREEYFSRIEHVNRAFRSGARQGYRSDRGRVYIVYGEPDDVDRHPSETERRPYEIWAYHQIQGGVVFVFVLKNPGGDYELVHSTHRNELRDDNWERPGVAY